MSDETTYHPGFKDGLKGFVLEPVFTLLGPRKKCPNENNYFGGYYTHAYMNHCPVCGEELDVLDNRFYTLLGLEERGEDE